LTICVVLGTKNPHKTREIREILTGLPLDLRPLPAGVREIDERGGTLEENAKLKATGYARALGETVLADDTGLFVDALSGSPGVRSARYAGDHAKDSDNRARLLAALRGVPDARRSARFRCIVALARPGELLGTFEGVLEGRILDRERGSHGFGYDPLFFLPSHGCTLAELPPAAKNEVSHRARALSQARRLLLELAPSTAP
jgi:XTP/dITP diphosphohydrolase